MKNRDQINLHPTAIVHPEANIGRDTTIGPYCIIGKNVTIGNNVKLHAHVNVDGKTTIGDHCEIFPFASIGTIPQDLKYHGEAAELIIGHHNTIREHVTMNIGTAGDQCLTQVGNHCLFMVGSHVAHDCIVGNHVILANNASLAGHVTVGDHVIIGGLCGIHQFVRIGKHAMIGGVCPVVKDVLPYTVVTSDRAKLAGLNLIGLKRRGFDRHEISDLRQAYKVLFKTTGSFDERLKTTVSLFPNNNLVKHLLEFIHTDSKRNITTSLTKETV